MHRVDFFTLKFKCEGFQVEQVCVCVFPREDDDINDVASMAGVNLKEENARILTTMVGSVVQSCQDQPFLSPNPVLSRILHTGTSTGPRPTY